MLEDILFYFQNHSIAARIILVLVATFILYIVTGLVMSMLQRKFSQTQTLWDDALVRSVRKPFRMLIWVVGISLALDIAHTVDGEPLQNVINMSRNLGVIVTITWFLIRLINNVQLSLIKSAEQKGKNIDQAAIDSIGKLLRLMVFIVAGLIAMQTLGLSIAGALTFGGVGGIAVGFAAKDMLANFFGGLMIYLDRPFKKGDWIRSPDRELEGVVEDIGWRITRIRNFDSRPLYVPNANFSTITIENVTRMTNRRIYETVGIRYDDADAINKIVEQITDYLKSHQEIAQEQSVMVGFTTFSPSSLDIFIYCFTQTKSGPTYYKIKQEILLHIIEIVSENGAECAFPTTTVHVQAGAPNLKTMARNSVENQS